MRIHSCNSRNDNRRRQGYVLIAVLIVIVVLTLAAYRYSDMTLAEYRASEHILKNAQVKALANSGIHFAMAVLSDPNAFANTLVGNPYNNPGVFQNVAVDLGTDSFGNSRTGYFSVMCVNYTLANSDGTFPLMYGVTDEASKINLNSLLQIDPTGQQAYNMLNNQNFQQYLGSGGGQNQSGGLNSEIAANIVDWMLPLTATQIAGGVDPSTYEGLANPYQCEERSFDTVEEMMLISGITPQLFIGNDLNRNGTLDPDEDGTGGLNPGWAPYFTIYSRENNVDNSGNPRVNVNGQNLQTLYTQLQAVVSQDLAAAIVAYRIYSAASPTATTAQVGSASNLSSIIQQAMNASQPPKSQRNISSLYNLIGTSISIPGAGNQPATTYAFPIQDASSATELGTLLDECTTVATPSMPGRINVNTASSTVLYALPGLQQSDVAAITAAQPPPGTADPTDPTYYTPAWLFTQAGITASKLAALDRYITGRTQVYRIQAVGYFDKGGPVARIEAVVDTNNGNPRIIYYRDMTELGRSIDPRTNQ